MIPDVTFATRASAVHILETMAADARSVKAVPRAAGEIVAPAGAAGLQAIRGSAVSPGLDNVCAGALPIRHANPDPTTGPSRGCGARVATWPGMRTLVWIAVSALVACRSSGGGAPADGERTFWQCPAGQVFYMEYTPVPSTQAPLFVSGRDEPEARVACEQLHTGSRYSVEAWGKVNYYNPTVHLEFGPNGTGKAAAAPPFTLTHGPFAGRAAEFSLTYSLDGAMWEHSGEAHDIALIGHDQPVCFAAHDIKGGYGDNAGFYAVTLHEERLDFGCRAKPVDGSVGGGTGGVLCGKACTTDQRGVCGAGLWECPDGGPRVCTPRVPATADDDCDGLDDDCDGKTDEGFVSATCVADVACQAGFVATGHTQCENGRARCVARPGFDYCNGCNQYPRLPGALDCGECSARPCTPGRTRCIPGFVCKLGATPGCGTPSTGTECWPTGAATCQGCAGLRCWMPKDVTPTGVCP